MGLKKTLASLVLSTAMALGLVGKVGAETFHDDFESYNVGSGINPRKVDPWWNYTYDTGISDREYYQGSKSLLMTSHGPQFGSYVELVFSESPNVKIDYFIKYEESAGKTGIENLFNNQGGGGYYPIITFFQNNQFRAYKIDKVNEYYQVTDSTLEIMMDTFSDRWYHITKISDSNSRQEQITITDTITDDSASYVMDYSLTCKQNAQIFREMFRTEEGDFYVDNFTLNTDVPEPSTLSLLAIGGLSGLGVYVIRRKK